MRATSNWADSFHLDENSRLPSASLELEMGLTFGLNDLEIYVIDLWEKDKPVPGLRVNNS